jgi:hypothetical protein
MIVTKLKDSRMDLLAVAYFYGFFTVFQPFIFSFILLGLYGASKASFLSMELRSLISPR